MANFRNQNGKIFTQHQILCNRIPKKEPNQPKKRWLIFCTMMMRFTLAHECMIQIPQKLKRVWEEKMLSFHPIRFMSTSIHFMMAAPVITLELMHQELNTMEH